MNESTAITSAEGAQLTEMLAEHVPISLIMDLSVPTGPDSRDILDTEGAPDSTWWLPPAASHD